MSRLRTLAPLLLSALAFFAPRRAAAQTAAAPAPPEASPPEAQPDPHKERDELLFEADGISGGVGLLHTQHAMTGAPGQFRLGFVTEFFGASFLCTTSYPCPNASGGPAITSDTMIHTGATLTLSATITKWLEAYGATGAYGNTDNSNYPSLLQVLGDTQLGLKFIYPGTSVFHFGGVTELDLVNTSGSVGVAGSSTGGRFKLLGTADLREIDPKRPFPLRVSLNLGYSIDNSAQVLSAYEAALGAPATRIDRFGLEVNRVDHIDANLGFESFFVEGHVRPFIEYSMLFPVNRQGYECDPTNASSDGCLANDHVIPSTLTFGSRFYPWRPGFSVITALDVGVTGTNEFIEELSPTPPWKVYVGLGWAVDTEERPLVVKWKTVEKEVGPKPMAYLRGIVHEKPKAGEERGEPIRDAIVVFDDHPEITSRVSGSDGKFDVPVDPGSYKLTVHAKGYKEGTCGADMGPVPIDVHVDCVLEPALVEVTESEITISQQIQFQVDSAVILPESDALMKEIADTLIKNPRIKRVEIQGHTDSSGSEEYNQTLSEQRAASVKNWLVAHGVADDRLVSRGYGESRPLIPNVTKGMKAMNRRVQFIILEQTPAKK